MRTLFLLVFLAMLVPCSAFATPVISSTSGTYTNGEAITLTGTGFTVKPTAAPIVSSYDDDAAAANWSTGAWGGGWTVWIANEQELVATSPRSSFYQSSYKMSYDSSGPYSVVRYIHPQREDETYLSWWTYNDYPAHYGSTADLNAKWLRLYTSSTNWTTNGPVLSNHWDDAGSAPFLRVGTYIQPEYAPSCTGWSVAYTATGASLSSVDWFTADFGSGWQSMESWDHYELYCTFSTNLEAGEDTATLWKNGQTVFRAVDVSLQDDRSDDDVRTINLGQPSGGRTEAQFEWIDEVYFDSSVARIFVSDSPSVTLPDMATAHHSEIQVPSSWSDTSIEFTLNQGAFANGDTAYVYVVDVNGVGSDGEMIVFGDSAGGSLEGLSASVTTGTMSGSWTTDGAASWTVEAIPASGRSYSIWTESASFSFPVGATVYDVLVTSEDGPTATTSTGG